MPDHPVAGRVFPIIVWTGKEVIIWGGEKPSEQAWHADGAAFNPAASTWRDMTKSPLAPRSEHVAVWTGKEVLICCGRQIGSGIGAAAYDPSGDEWRVIATPPTEPIFAEAVWTGEEMIVFGGKSEGGVGNLVGAMAYDPDNDSWRSLSDLPYGLGDTSDSTLNDNAIYAWPSRVGSETFAPVAFDLLGEEWRQLPKTPTDAPSTPDIAWVDGRLFAYGAVGEGEEVVGVGLMFDPATKSWLRAAEPPLEPVSASEGSEGSQAIVAVGTDVYVWTGWVGTDANQPITRVLTYSVATNTWEELDPAPVDARGMWADPLLWTGHELVVYGEPILVFAP